MWRIAILAFIICSNLVNGEPKVPCHFIFGDSLFDAGNNNGLNTMAKANFPPYGVDFPGRGATGRFSNGLTMADFITQFAGFERLIAPYNAQMSQDILRGVNFASGVSGILPETGSQMTLYNSGARKLAIFGLGQLGCVPAVMKMNNASQCVEENSRAVEPFNRKLAALVDYFNANLRGAKFTFINISAMQVSTPLPIGFITGTTCCRLTSNFQCQPNTPPCPNRDLYAFMDGYHPTEILSRLAATNAFSDQTSLFAHPMNIRQLISN